MKHLYPAILLILLPLPAGLPEELPPAPPPACAAQDIRQVDFGNHTYTRMTSPDDGRPPVVRMRGRKYFSDAGAEVFMMRSAYGDLTGDGLEEAAVVLRGQNTSISRTLDEVFVYGMDGGGAALLANFDGGRRGDYVFGVTIEAGLLKLDLAVMPDCTKTNDDCIPTRYHTLTYRLEDGGVTEVERTPLSDIPEHLKEIG